MVNLNTLISVDVWCAIFDEKLLFLTFYFRIS